MSANKIAVTIPKGALLTVTSGEYSDYTIHGVFRAVADIDAEALRAEYVATHPNEAQKYHFREDKFLGWVARKGLLETVECYEWSLGSSGIVDRMTAAHFPKGPGG